MGMGEEKIILSTKRERDNLLPMVRMGHWPQ
jgi:hypothetical protein